MLQILFETHFLFKNIVWMPVVMSEIFQLSHVYNIRGIYVRQSSVMALTFKYTSGHFSAFSFKLSGSHFRSVLHILCDITLALCTSCHYNQDNQHQHDARSHLYDLHRCASFSFSSLKADAIHQTILRGSQFLSIMKGVSYFVAFYHCEG